MTDASGAIPTSYDQLIAEHGGIVRWAVARTLKPHRATPEDINDVVQDVYVRVIEKDYLTRCRDYAATVSSYKFSTSLAVLARNVAISHLRAKGVRARFAGPSLDDVEREVGNNETCGLSPFDTDRGQSAARLTEAVAAKLQLSSLRSKVDGIAFGTATIGTLIDTALAHDGQLTDEAVEPLQTRVKYARRRLREVAHRAAAEATYAHA